MDFHGDRVERKKCASKPAAQFSHTTGTSGQSSLFACEEDEEPVSFPDVVGGEDDGCQGLGGGHEV